MGDDDALGMYVAQIEQYPCLTDEQQQSLAEELSAWNADLGGVTDREAAKRLVEANLRLVVPIAKRHEGHGLSLFALISEGNLGLIRAVSTFDHRSGDDFPAFVRRCIEEAIGDAFGGPPAAGVREPRRPGPEAGSGAMEAAMEG